MKAVKHEEHTKRDPILSARLSGIAQRSTESRLTVATGMSMPENHLGKSPGLFVLASGNGLALHAVAYDAPTNRVKGNEAFDDKLLQFLIFKLYFSCQVKSEIMRAKIGDTGWDWRGCRKFQTISFFAIPKLRYVIGPRHRTASS